MLFGVFGKRKKKPAEKAASTPPPKPEKKPAKPVSPAEAAYDTAFMADLGIGKKMEKAEILRLYEEAAQLGHTSAAFRCGRMYEKGEGTEKDLEKALAYFLQAAEQGDPHAQDSCGRMYLQGKGVPADPHKALEWLERAAGQGYWLAQEACGKMYMEDGPVHDPQKALHWYTQLANGPEADPTALLKCADLCAGEGGLTPNKEEALEWLRRCREHPYYQKNEIYRSNVAWVEARLWPDIRESDETLVPGPGADALLEKGQAAWEAERYSDAVEAFTQAAHLSSTEAMVQLGHLYEKEGTGIQDTLQSFMWMYKAAQAGDPEGQYWCAMKYREGDGVDSSNQLSTYWLERAVAQGQKDALVEKGQAAWEAERYNEAAQYFTQAIERGSTRAMVQLSRLYEKEGTGLQDAEKSVQWMEKAAELGDVDAMKDCMNREYRGVNHKWDFQKLRYWAEKLADMEDGDGCYMMGLIYYEGYGVAKDMKKASRYLKAAMDQHVEGASKKYYHAEFKLAGLFDVDLDLG